MSLDIQRSQVAAFSSKQAVTETVAESIRQEGMLMGQSVKESNPQIANFPNAETALANSAEEMGIVFQENLSKTLSERKQGSKDARLNAAELAQKWVNMLGESTNPQKLQEFLDSLKKMGRGASEEQLRQLARESFGDVSEQYGALAYAEEALKQEGGNEELLAKVGAAKEALMKEAGPAIRAGLNIATDVLNFSKQGLEQLEKLRDLYRFAVLGRQTVSDMYGAIMSRYGESRFPQALDFLIQAAGHDLDAGGWGPSMENAQLETAVNNINYVQQLGNLHRVLADLMDKVRPPVMPAAHAR
jgi:type III secretion protein W